MGCVRYCWYQTMKAFGMYFGDCPVHLDIEELCLLVAWPAEQPKSFIRVVPRVRVEAVITVVNCEFLDGVTTLAPAAPGL